MNTGAKFVSVEKLKTWRRIRSEKDEARNIDYLTACFADLNERQLLPILIMPDGRIIDGYCRWRALIAAGRDNAWVVEWPANRKEPSRSTVEQMNVGNVHVESSVLYFKRIEKLNKIFGWSFSKLANVIGIDAETLERGVSTLRKLLKQKEDHENRQNHFIQRRIDASRGKRK